MQVEFKETLNLAAQKSATTGIGGNKEWVFLVSGVRRYYDSHEKINCKHSTVRHMTHVYSFT